MTSSYSVEVTGSIPETGFKPRRDSIRYCLSRLPAEKIAIAFASSDWFTSARASAPALAASCTPMPGARPFCARSAGSTTHLPISIVLLRWEPSVRSVSRNCFSPSSSFRQARGAIPDQGVNSHTTGKTVAGISQHMPGVQIYRVGVCIAPIIGFELRSSAIVKESGSAKRSYLV
jgi:hypothetical protein